MLDVLLPLRPQVSRAPFRGREGERVGLPALLDAWLVGATSEHHPHPTEEEFGPELKGAEQS